MNDHDFTHHFMRGTAALGLLVASLFAFVLVTADSVSIETAFATSTNTQPAAVIVAQTNELATAPAAPSCVDFSMNLYEGMTDATTNGQVSQLQQFLGITPTGYFGPITQGLVQSWQASHGIVSAGTTATTGYGFVGPHTRAAMGCGSNSTSQNSSSQSGVTTNPGSTGTSQSGVTSNPGSTSNSQSGINNTGNLTNVSQSSSARPSSAANGAASQYSITNLRGSDSVVIQNGNYSYDPSVIDDNGLYKAYWCTSGQYQGDNIFYGQASALGGPWTGTGGAQSRFGAGFNDVFWSTWGAGKFDSIHTCDPSVIKVNGTYYMYYTGSDSTGAGPGAIGVASSADGVNWTRMNNDQPVVSTANVQTGNGYGVGEQSVAYANGMYYLTYIDTTGAASLPNGAGEYVIRATDPLFSQNVQVLTSSGWAARTSANATSYIFFNGLNTDMAYVPAWNDFLMLSNSDLGEVHVVLLDPNFSVITDQVIPSTQWCDGPGLVTNADRTAIMPNANTISVDLLRAVGTCGNPYTYQIAWRGADLVKSGAASLPTISSFTASPSSITAGQNDTLSWNTSGATSISISGLGSQSGTSVQVTPSQTTTYTLTATNSAGSATAQATVTVSSVQSSSLTASPTSGVAPLSVSFNAQGLTSSQSYVINFGDGTNGAVFFPASNCPNGGCIGSVSGSALHTYQSAGTYTATLLNSAGNTLASATVTVTGVSQSVSFSAAPTSGAAPLSVSFSTGLMLVNSSNSINFGDGSNGTLTQGQCYGISATSGQQGGVKCYYSASHTYQSANTYTATLLDPAGNTLASATVTVTGSSQGTVTFTAVPSSGTAPLAVSFSASGLMSGNTYTVNFGDGSTGSVQVSNPTCAQNATCGPVGNASHTYQSAGTYTATLFNSSGATLSSATVTVNVNTQHIGTSGVSPGSN